MLSILGIGSVSAMGSGLDSMRAVLRGSSTPCLETTTIRVGQTLRELTVYRASPGGLDRFIPRRALRRMDEFTRTALLSAFLAVEDAGFQFEDRTRIGIVLGSGYGPLTTTFEYQDTIIADGDKGASPTLFANSVHNAPASALSISMDIAGPSVTLTNLERTTTEVLRCAGVWLEQGKVDYVLAGVGDEYCPVLGYTINRLCDRTSDPITPLCADACSYLPGQGFVTFLLGRDFSTATYGRVDGILEVSSPGELDAVLLADHRLICLSANGDRRNAHLYDDLQSGDAAVACYSPLYGSMPGGLAFDLAIAGLSCADGRLYPSPAATASSHKHGIPRETTLSPGDRIACIQCLPNRTTLISIAKR